MWSYTQGTGYALRSSSFEGVKLTKYADPDKYSYSGYSTGFGAHRSFPLSNGSDLGKNIIIFGPHMSSFEYIDDKKKDVLILSKDPTDVLDDTALTAEKEYPTNCTEQQKKFCLTLHYNGPYNYALLTVLKYI